MPYILNVSNLAMVSGPINIMEPLTAGIPVIFMNNSDVITEYDPKAFDKMAQHATHTGGGFEIQSLSGLTTAVTKALKNSLVITPPYLVIDPTTKMSAAENLVNAVLGSVQRGFYQSQYVSEHIKEYRKQRRLESEGNRGGMYHDYY